MAERILAKGEKGQHQCNRCLKLFDFTDNGQWIPTTCPKCKALYGHDHSDHLLWHLEVSIKEAKEGIKKWQAAVDRDEAFITEFAESNPETADIYRSWKEFDQERLSLIQQRLPDLQERLAQRQRAGV